MIYNFVEILQGSQKPKWNKFIKPFISNSHIIIYYCNCIHSFGRGLLIYPNIFQPKNPRWCIFIEISKIYLAVWIEHEQIHKEIHLVNEPVIEIEQWYCWVTTTESWQSKVMACMVWPEAMNSSGVHYTSNFSIMIWIWLKIFDTIIHTLNEVTATNFCSWHDNTAVIACAKMCTNQTASNEITATNY